MFTSTLTMPIIRADQGSQPRTTFKPPWVRDGPSPLPMPAAPWTARARENAAGSGSTDEPGKFERPTLRKQSKVTIVPSQPVENGQVFNATNQKPPTYGNRKVSTEKIVPIFRDSALQKSNLKKTGEIPMQKPPPANEIHETAKEAPKPPPQSCQAPMPPPPPPTSALPPPPPMPGGLPPIERKPLTVEKLAKIEALKSRPRRRPDWTDMMKEVESGKKLKHVQCNDRSAPVLPETKAKGQFVYDSEQSKDDSHNALLKEIQFGVKLKRVKCNDRSKPNIDGLRKFRRQMTVEEQIQKSMSMADVVAAAAEPDELDDIDKVRDDLQSSKQMLAQELRNKEALERENKRLMARLLNLEVELEKEKGMRLIESEKGATIVESRTEEDKKLIEKLKEEAQDADKIAKEMEEKYHATAEELDNTRRKLESAWLRNQELEIQLKAAEAQGVKFPPSLIKAPSSKKLAQSIANMANGKSLDLSDDDSDEYEEETETESEDSENEANAAEKEERRTARELRLLETKVKTYKEKQQAAKKERKVLREQMKKQQKTLREEKKKYKVLQKEVDKMAKLMRDAEEEEEEEMEEDEEEAEEEEETETESESEESSSEEESDDEIPEDASTETRKKLLSEKTKQYDNRLTTLKKGNYLLKANIDRLQDDIARQREMQLDLQEDLNSVLTDLG